MINSQNSLSSNAVQRRLGWQLLGTRMVEIVLAPLVLFGIFWFYLGKFLGGEFSTATWQDNTYLINPIFSFISRTFASGEFPYWIDSIIGGVPLYSTPQFSILYPLYFFGSDLYRTPLDALIYVHYVTLLHLFIFYLNSYIMLRIFRIPILSSIVGATFLALS